MVTKVVFDHRAGSHSSVYMVYRWTDDEWVPEQYFPHNEREKAIEFARDLSQCEYGGEADIWNSEKEVK